jgi:hypothetical protein
MEVVGNETLYSLGVQVGLLSSVNVSPVLSIASTLGHLESPLTEEDKSRGSGKGSESKLYYFQPTLTSTRRGVVV